MVRAAWFVLCVIMVARDASPADVALEAINEERGGALRCGEILRTIAETRAREIAAPGEFAHWPPGATERRVVTLAAEHGLWVNWLGEVLAFTASDDGGHTVDLWMASERHRAVLLDGDWTAGCVGHYSDAQGHWWAGVFVG